MTSTITAEERAKTVIEAFSKLSADIDFSAEMSALIAAAIRDAERCVEDAAYERAAKIADANAEALSAVADGYHERGQWTKARDAAECASESEDIAKDIRKLKSPSPPKDQGHE